MAVTLETAARNAACDAIVDLVDGGAGAGVLEFKTSGGTSTKGNGQVCEMTLNDPAFGAASTGVATLDVDPAISDTNADGGTTTKAYFYDSNNNPLFSCTVSTSGADINLSNNVITAGETVTITSLTVTVPA
jgi:hypothetical protein